ncbi:MAG TPA: hypothetical protein PK228_22310, partial [Saprospiraceae bacterium]|nr:hypothetical protein [Saprospiraceae bacterium]
MKRLLTIFLLLLTGGVQLIAQIGCPPGAPPFGSPVCQAACIVCDMNSGLDGQLPIPFPIPPPLQPPILDCFLGGDLTLNNPIYYSFIAGSPVIQIAVKATGCQTGAGIEAAIFYSCDPTSVAIWCGVIDPMNPIIPFNIFVEGAQYYLLIDGVDGDVCKYSVEIVAGSANPFELGNLGTIQGPTQVCPNGLFNYSIDPVQFALSYTWTAPPGAKINGGGNTLTLPASNGLAYIPEIKFGTVGGNVCVTATNSCDTPKTTCITITNTAIPINILPEKVICYEELPYIWEEEPNNVIFAPGTYTFTSSVYHTIDHGCDSTVRQKIRALPQKYKVLPTKYLCEPECFVLDGFEYCQSGTYQQTLSSVDGCDSIINFTLVRIPVHAEAQVKDTLTCAQSSVLLTSEGSSTGNSIFYNWLDPSGHLVSEGDTVLATTPGMYTLIVTNFGGGGNACKDTATVVV